MTSHVWAARIMWYGWAAFGLFWLVTAVKTKAVQQRESAGNRLRTFLAELVGYLILFWGPNLNGWEERIIPRSPAWDGFAIAATVAGVGIAIWARVTLAGNWSASITLKDDHELIQRGPYHWVRHPIYTGILLLILANVAVIGKPASVVGFLVLLWAYWRKWRIEERLMTTHFGAQYVRYRLRTGAVVPGW